MSATKVVRCLRVFFSQQALTFTPYNELIPVLSLHSTELFVADVASGADLAVRPPVGPKRSGRL